MSWILTLFVPNNISISRINTIARKYNFELSSIYNDTTTQELPFDTIPCSAISLDSKYYIGEEFVENTCLTGISVSQTLANAGINIDENYIKALELELRTLNQSKELKRQKWADFITDFLVQNKGCYLGMILHFYKGTPESEELIIEQILESQIDTLSAETLFNIKEDTLYLFRNKTQGDGSVV